MRHFMPSSSRRKPYTAGGIQRVPCARCGLPSRYQWQICADKRVYRGLCRVCDVALNALVLKFVGDPWAAEKIALYRAKVREA